MKITGTHILIALGSITLVVGIGYVYRRQIKAGVKDIINYAFTKEQELFLKDLNPNDVNTFRKFIVEIESTTPYKVLITSGYRSFAKQAQLHKENKSNSVQGKSMHNYGEAIDINLVSKKDGSIIKKADTSETWEKTGVVKIAKKYNLKWGGGGAFGGYHDPVHFEVPLGGDKLYVLALKQFGSESKIIGNQVKIA